MTEECSVFGVATGLVGCNCTAAGKSARTRMAIEEHGAGRQFVRFRVWPTVSAGGIVAALALAVLAAAATSDGAGLAAGILGAGALFVAIRVVWECGSAQAVIGGALAACKAEWTDD